MRRGASSIAKSHVVLSQMCGKICGEHSQPQSQLEYYYPLFNNFFLFTFRNLFIV